MYIGVSGNLGSGKSTVAAALGNAFACQVYPRHSYNRTYIEDLFREPSRWTTEAQISFIVHKYQELTNALREARLFVLDRTLDEEVAVFAERFHQDGTIDDRSITLIRQIADYFRQSVIPPKLIVYCDTPVDICYKRLQERPARTYQENYPTNHLQMLREQLELWLDKQSVPVLKIYPADVDYRQEPNAMALAKQIEEKIIPSESRQPGLFEEIVSLRDDDSSSRSSLLRRRQVYLAAPFSSKAVSQRSPAKDGRLFADRPIENIPMSYRKALTMLSRAIESHGYDVLLPHRDINNWGRRVLSEQEVASRCLSAVAESDFFIGLIAESFGSHAELAYALALKKPCLVLFSSREATSFFGSGMSHLPGVATLRASSMAALTKAIREKNPVTRMIWGR